MRMPAGLFAGFLPVLVFCLLVAAPQPVQANTKCITGHGATGLVCTVHGLEKGNKNQDVLKPRKEELNAALKAKRQAWDAEFELFKKSRPVETIRGKLALGIGELGVAKDMMKNLVSGSPSITEDYKQVKQEIDEKVSGMETPPEDLIELQTLAQKCLKSANDLIVEGSAARTELGKITELLEGAKTVLNTDDPDQFPSLQLPDENPVVMAFEETGEACKTNELSIAAMSGWLKMSGQGYKSAKSKMTGQGPAGLEGKEQAARTMLVQELITLARSFRDAVDLSSQVKTLADNLKKQLELKKTVESDARNAEQEKAEKYKNAGVSDDEVLFTGACSQPHSKHKKTCLTLQGERVESRRKVLARGHIHTCRKSSVSVKVFDMSAYGQCSDSEPCELTLKVGRHSRTFVFDDTRSTFPDQLFANVSSGNAKGHVGIVLKAANCSPDKPCRFERLNLGLEFVNAVPDACPRQRYRRIYISRIATMY